MRLQVQDAFLSVKTGVARLGALGLTARSARTALEAMTLGRDLGTRTVEPHLAALRHFGLDVVATHGFYEATSDSTRRPTRPIVLTERGDTVTENVLLAAGISQRELDVIRANAIPN